MPGLLADIVEAFIPPGREPEMLAYATPCSAPVRWPLRPVDWTVSVAIANPVAASAAEPVEAFLPPFAEPQSVAWPTATALPRMALNAADWLAATPNAEVVGGPAAQPVEAFLPPFAEPRSVAWPSATALPRMAIEPAEWLAVNATAMAEPIASPAAQPVEAFLPPFVEPQSVAWPAAPALPQLALDAADWLAASAIAEPVAGPAAQPVEAFLPEFAEPRSIAWPTVTALPRMAIEPAEWLAVNATAMAEPVAGPAAQPVEAFLPPFAEPLNVAWPTATALPRMAIEPAEWLAVNATAMAEPVAGPAAQPVESFLPSPAEPQIASWPVTASVLPRLTSNATTRALSVDVAGPVPAPAAQALESFLPPQPEPQIVEWPASAIALPRLTVDSAAWVLSVELMEPSARCRRRTGGIVPAAFRRTADRRLARGRPLSQLSLDAAEWVLAGDIAETANGPAAQAVESLLPALPEPCALPIFQQALCLPEFTLAAIAPEAVEEFVPPVVIADACQDWMPSAPACEAEREVIPSFGDALAAEANVQHPLNFRCRSPRFVGKAIGCL